MTLIDKNEAFVFGYSKLDVMFGRATPDAVADAYRDIAKPGVRFLRETVTAIDPEARRVTTDAGTHEADILVIALGADYDLDATPGSPRAGTSSTRSPAPPSCADVPDVHEGHAVIGVCGAPFKCPPAPSECALLLHDDLVARGVRADCQITVVIPFPSPCRRRPRPRQALLDGFAERDIAFIPDRRVGSVEPRAASPCSTTAPSCRSTSSSACRSTAPPTSCSRAA